MAFNLDNYNQQVASIQGQLAALQQKPYPPINQNMYPQQIPFQQDTTPPQVKRVDGPDGAREYQSKLPYNSSDVVFDKDNDVFYLVYKDANGISPKLLTIGHFTLEQEAANDPVYVTKQDLEAMEARIIATLTSQKTLEVTDE